MAVSVEAFDEVENNVDIHDAGDGVGDRYTVVFKDCPVERKPGYYLALGMDAHPFHPQGIGMHTEAMAGDHLGKRIKFEDLPVDCRRLVLQDLAEIRAEEASGHGQVESPR
jgi:hypothetical protein